jgi:hypothetical protein
LLLEARAKSSFLDLAQRPTNFLGSESQEQLVELGGYDLSGILDLLDLRAYKAPYYFLGSRIELCGDALCDDRFRIGARRQQMQTARRSVGLRGTGAGIRVRELPYGVVIPVSFSINLGSKEGGRRSWRSKRE